MKSGLLRRLLSAITPGSMRAVGDADMYAKASGVIVKDNWESTGEPRTGYEPSEYAAVATREPWVYACVHAIATDLSGLPIGVLDDDKQPIPKPWKSPLDIFEMPNVTQSFDQLLYQLVFDYILCGASYELWTGLELWRLPSALMTPIPTKSGLIKQFCMTDGQRKQYFDPAEIIYVPNYSPVQYINGMSSLEPLQDTIKKAAYQIDYEKALWKNYARVPSLLRTEQPMSVDQRKQHADEWNAKYSGTKNAGKTAVLSHGLEYQRVGLDVQESGYHESREENREEILAVLDVPPVRVGLQKHVNYANAMAQMAGYFRSNIGPKARMFANAHSRVVFAKVPLWLSIDASNNVFSAADKGELWNIAARATGWRQIITQNEARALCGYPAHSDPEADEVNKPPAALWPALPGSADRLTDLGALEEVSATSGSTPGGELSVDRNAVATRRLAELQIRAKQQRVDRHKTNLDRELDLCKAEVALPLLRTMREANLAALADDIRSRGMRVMTRATAPTMPDASRFDDDAKRLLGDYLREEYKRVGDAEVAALLEYKQARRAARGLSMRATIAAALDLFDPVVSESIKARQQQIVTVTETVEQLIRNDIAQLAEDGRGIQDMRDAVMERFDELEGWEAERIARTESGSGSNTAANIAMWQQDVDEIGWSSYIDEATRQSHEQMDGQTVHIGEKFPNGLRFPMDPEGSAGEVINCRCTHYAVSFKDED